MHLAGDPQRSRGGVPGGGARGALRLIARKRELNDRRGLPARTRRELPLLRVQVALPAVPGGAAALPDRSAARERAADAVSRARSSRAMGARAHRGAVARDLDAARALRARRGRRVRQDLGDGGAGRVPGARRARPRSTRRTGVLPGNVLCLTFTNKATENLRCGCAVRSPRSSSPRARSPRSRTTTASPPRCSTATGCSPASSPGTRVLSAGAAHRALRARARRDDVRARVGRRASRRSSSKILELDDQAQNHLVDARRRSWPSTSAAGAARRTTARIARTAPPRSGSSSRERRCALPRAQARARRDRLRRPDRARARRRGEPPGGRGRTTGHGSSAVLLDEYQDTNVAQAQLMRLVFGGGHPVTAVGDPDQNIYAWRGASLFNLLEFPQQFPPRRRLARGASCPSTRTSAPARGSSRRPTRSSGRCRPPSGPTPRSGSSLTRRTARARSRVTRAPGRVDRGQRDRRSRRRAARRRAPRWSDVAVLCRTSPPVRAAAAGVRRTRGAGGGARARRSAEAPRGRRGARLRARGATTRSRIGRARADPDGPALPRRVQGRRAASPRSRQGRARAAARVELGLDEDERFLFAEALEHLDEVEGLSDEGRARLEGSATSSRRCACEARRPVGGVPGRGDPAHRVPRRARRRRSTGRARSRRDAQPRRVPRRGARVRAVEGELTLRAFLDYVDAVEALDKQEWAPVQPSDEDSVKVMTIHVAKGLEFDHVFVPGLRARAPAEPDRSRRTRRSAGSRSTSSCAATPRHPAHASTANLSRVQGRPAAPGDHRGAAHRLRGAHARAALALRLAARTGTATTRDPKKPERVPRRAARLGRAAPATPRSMRGPDGARRREPDARAPRAVRARLAGPGAARRGRRAVPRRVARRRARATASAACSLAGRGARRRRTARRSRRSPPSDGQVAAHLRERETAEGVPPAERRAALGLGRRRRRLRAVPEALLLDERAPAPSVQRPRGADRHRDPPVDRAARARPGHAARARRRRPTSPTRSSPATPARVERLRQAFLESRFADVTPLFAERAFLLRLGGVQRSAGRIDAIFGEPGRARGRSSTGRPAAAARRRSRSQLDLYGLACVEIWGKRPEDVTLTYFYLASGEEVVRIRWATPTRSGARVAASLGVDRRGRVRADARPGVRVTATSARSATPARRGWQPASAGCSLASRRRARAAPSRRRTSGSRRPGRSRPRDPRHERAATSPVSADARTCAAARNHSRVPGWTMTSPLCPAAGTRHRPSPPASRRKASRPRVGAPRRRSDSTVTSRRPTWRSPRRSSGSSSGV